MTDELFLPDLDIDFEFNTCRVVGFTGRDQDAIAHTFRRCSSVPVIDLGQFDQVSNTVLFEGTLAFTTTNAVSEMRMHYLMDQIAQRPNATVVVTHLQSQSEIDFVLAQSSASAVFMVPHENGHHYFPEIEANPDILLRLL